MFCRNPKVATVILSAALALAGQAAAQVTPTAPAAPAPAVAPAVAPAPSYRNALRLDVGGILAYNMGYNLMATNPQLLLPLMVSYERQLGVSRFSGVVEGLVNGGEPDERKSGLTVQARYYALPHRRQGALAGVYVAPTAGFRSVKLYPYYYGGRVSPGSANMLGGGLLVGWQSSFSKKSRFFFDVAAGAMTWQRVGSQPGYDQSGQNYKEETYYEHEKLVFDGRLGLGFKF